MLKPLLIIITFIFVFQNATADTLTCDSSDVKVIDADTINLCDTKIRLFGISAAERGHSSYKQCKIIVKDIIEQSDKVSCELTGDKTYDRLVGICSVMSDNKSTNLHRLIIENSCARDCESYSGGIYKIYETEGAKELPLPNYCK
jgi:micrococcal nuclease